MPYAFELKPRTVFSRQERQLIHRSGQSIDTQQRLDDAIHPTTHVVWVTQFTKGSTSLNTALPDAIESLVEFKGGAVFIPAGRWTLDEPVHCVLPGDGSPSVNYPITIVGAGRNATIIEGHTGTSGEALLQFDANWSGSPGYAEGGILQDLTLWGSDFTSVERGVGVRFKDTVFGGIYRCHIRGYTTGLDADTTQDFVAEDAVVQACETGALLHTCNQMELRGFKANQNSGTGVKYTGGLCSWTRGLCQNSGTGPSLWIAPALAGGSWLDLDSIYFEGDGSPNIQIDAPLSNPAASGGTVTLKNLNFFSAGGVPPLIASKCELVIETWTGNGTPLITATDCSIRGSGFTSLNTYNLDLDTRKKSSWQSSGASSVGLPPVPASLGGAVFQDRRFDIATDLASELSDYWDAEAGVTFNADGTVNTVTGQFAGTVLTAAGTTKPSLENALEFGGKKAFKFTAANQSRLYSGVIGTPLGTSNDYPWALVVVARTVFSSGAGYEWVWDVRNSAGDTFDCRVNQNGASIDLWETEYSDHISGGVAAQTNVDGTHGHILQSSSSSTAVSMTVDTNSPVSSAGGFSSTHVGPVNRISIGSNRDQGGTSDANLKVALFILCKTKPSAAKISALYTWLRSRYGL